MSHDPSIAPSDWRRAVSVKRASMANAIPPAWRLSDDEIPSSTILKDLTSFITRFLSPLEQQITTAPVSVLLSNVSSSQWSAVEITRAFCHRAALAHQLVSGSFSCAEHRRRIETINRRHASLRFVLQRQNRELRSLIRFCDHPGNSLVHYTVFQSLLRTVST